MCVCVRVRGEVKGVCLSSVTTEQFEYEVQLFELRLAGQQGPMSVYVCVCACLVNRG
jgi:hypothetical protein